MKELIIRHWKDIVGYLAVGWLLGAMLFRGAFVTKACSMDGNSGGQPLLYYRVDTPSMSQAFAYVLGVVLWPFALVALGVFGIVGLGCCVMESKSRAFPCIVKWVFGWPLLLVLRLRGERVDHEENKE